MLVCVGLSVTVKSVQHTCTTVLANIQMYAHTLISMHTIKEYKDYIKTIL